jgi:hypothetical protein
MGLLSLAFKKDERTVEALAKDGAEVAANLERPIESHEMAALQQLRDFALRLSSAAQQGPADDLSFWLARAR